MKVMVEEDSDRQYKAQSVTNIIIYHDPPSTFNCVITPLYSVLIPIISPKPSHIALLVAMGEVGKEPRPQDKTGKRLDKASNVPTTQTQDDTNDVHSLRCA